MRLSTKHYAEILDKALAEHPRSAEAIAKEFAMMLQKDGKLSKANEILKKFGKLWNKRHNEVDVEVESADEHFKLPHEVKDKKINLSLKINKDLLGGSIIKIGDYIVDTSVKAKINALRN